MYSRDSLTPTLFTSIIIVHGLIISASAIHEVNKISLSCEEVTTTVQVFLTEFEKNLGPREEPGAESRHLGG